MVKSCKPTKIKGWEYTESKSNIKPNMEGWFRSWQRGREQIEIIRYYDDDEGKWGDFEVWEQIANKEGDSWDGEHLDSHKNYCDAMKSAEKIVKRM